MLRAVPLLLVLVFLLPPAAALPAGCIDPVCLVWIDLDAEGDGDCSPDETYEGETNVWAASVGDDSLVAARASNGCSTDNWARWEYWMRAGVYALHGTVVEVDWREGTDSETYYDCGTMWLTLDDTELSGSHFCWPPPRLWQI